MSLTPKQEKYVQGLFGGLSQRQAYREAYESSNKWKDSTVDSRASELAANSKILGRLKELQDEYQEKREWDLDKLIEEWTNLKEKCMDAKPVYDKWGNPTGIYQFAWGGAAKSLENIGKLLGYYKDKLEVTQTKKLEDVLDDD